MTGMSGPGRDRPTALDLFELMAVLAHDLRTPLTPVRGYAEILRTKQGIGPEKTAQYAAIIVDAAARMERSVDMLSGISTLYGGRAEIHPETLRAVDVVAERIDIWRGRLPERTFEGHTEAAYGDVIADRGWLGKALDVLIEHAVRSWPAPAVISIGARTNPGAQSTRFTAGAVSMPEVREGSSSDRLAQAFITAVSDVCGYPLRGDFEIDVAVSRQR
jgi:signal transduction histidine kinase